MRASFLSLLFLALLMAGGCGGVRFMEPTTAFVTLPPPGKALVNFFRPSDWEGDEELAIFDGLRLIGNIEDEMMFTCIVDPGEHLFISRKQKVSVISATLLPGRTYDVLISSDVISAWGSDVYMVPITRDSKYRRKLDAWEEDLTHMALVRDAETEALERRMAGALDRITRDFTTGEKRDRLLVLSAEDHR